VRFLESFIQTKGVPGVTAAFIEADGAEHVFAAGFADRARGVPMDVRNRMPAGSVGKTFGAALAVLLADDGLIDLDAPIAGFAQKLAWMDRVPNADSISLRMVLAHRTGLANYVHLPAWRSTYVLETAKDPQFAFSIEAEILLAAEEGAVCEPDSETRYTDTNYLIAGRIIEAVSGRDYYELMAERILRPHALIATTPCVKRAIPGLASGDLDEKLVEHWGPISTDAAGALIYNPEWEFAGGGLVSTPADLARFMKKLFEGRVVSPAGVEAMSGGFPMEYPLPNHLYGLGVQSFDTDFGRVRGHTGQLFGYRSVALYFDDSRIVIAFQINADVVGLLPLIQDLAAFAHTPRAEV
jgi:D-alanyl-D-alanine carboxypeptidase